MSMLKREELEKIISICESIESKGLDPFSVNIKELLMKLRRILSESKDMELIVLDAETLYKIAVVISLQHRWLKERVASLLIDSQLVSMKVASMDKRALAEAFVRAWRPIVSLEQMTSFRIRQGMEHFLMLPPRPDRRRGIEVTKEELLSRIGLDEVRRSSLLLEEEVRRLHEEALRMAGDGGEMDYWEFVKAGDFKEMVWRAYVTSFMVSQGLAELLTNPITGSLKIRPHKEKIKMSSPRSLVVTLYSGGVDERG